MSITPLRHKSSATKLTYDSDMRELMEQFGVIDFEVHPQNVGPIKGESWEMAATMSMLGRPGNYTGTLEDYSDSVASFGPVRGVNVKRKLLKHEKLYTYSDFSTVDVSPDVH
uniref:Uncharacterized protein n=1 Tax=viral metagenome TaxID=1070528 RepID=A0A2V0RC08_9ZZZZ